MIFKKLPQFLPLLLLLLIFNTTLNAQKYKSNHAKFTAVTVNKNAEKNLNNVFKAYSLFSLDTDDITVFAQQHKGNEVILDLVFPGLDSFSLTLQESEILSPDYQAIIASANGREVIRGQKQISYKGSITNKDYNRVRLTITNNVIHGIIKTDSKEYFIEPLRYITGAANRNIFVIYEIEDIVLDPLVNCGVTEINKVTDRILNDNQRLDLGDCFRVEVALASDESAVTAIGGSALDMEVYNIGLMNIVSPYFKDFEFATNVELVLTGQYISTSAATDPYDIDCNSCDIDDQLDQFGFWAVNGGFGSINYDLAHNITNHFPPPGTVGLAWIGTVGNPNYKFGVSNITNPTWLTFIHELGHNFGLQHSFEEGQGSTGGFMDYGDGTLNGEYSWNPFYREAEFEAEVNSAAISVCSVIGPAVADFESLEVACEGSTIEFNNTSLGGATSYSWTFAGGTPSTSTDIDPSVTYSTNGEKTVSLIATNENGSSTMTKTIIIANTPNAASCSPTGTWTGNANDAGSTFFELNTISKTSGGCQTDGNYYLDYSCTDATVLELGTAYTANVSHLYQGSTTSQNQLFIDYNNDGDFSDANEVAYNGTDLSFTITTPSSGVVENEMLRARLIVKVFSSSLDPCYQPTFGEGQIEDYGVYFSNESVLSISDNSELPFSVFPNPINDGNFTIRMPNATTNTKLIIYDSLGRIIYSSFLEAKVSNDITLDSSVSSGLYFIKMIQGQRVSTKKLIIR